MNVTKVEAVAGWLIWNVRKRPLLVNMRPAVSNGTVCRLAAHGIGVQWVTQAELEAAARMAGYLIEGTGPGAYFGFNQTDLKGLRRKYNEYFSERKHRNYGKIKGRTYTSTAGIDRRQASFA